MTVEMISHLLEALMILCFGLSWPLSIYKSWTSRTAKGKSLYFEVFIWIGYIFGIANKFISYMNNPDKDWIFFLAWAFLFPEHCRDHRRYGAVLPQCKTG